MNNEIFDVPISELTEGIQLRIGTRDTTISEYAETMKEEGWGSFPPIEVCRVDDQWRIADGHHRWFAALEVGVETVPCRQVGSTSAELVLYAVQGNARHGLRFTKEERKNAVLAVMREFPQKSIREVAKICGVAKSTVNRIQNELYSAGELIRPLEVVGKDGKCYSSIQNMVQDNSGVPLGHLTERAGKEKTSGQFDQSRSGFSPPPNNYASVTCANCGLKLSRELVDLPDSTWEKRDFNPAPPLNYTSPSFRVAETTSDKPAQRENFGWGQYNPDTGQYEHYFCCDDCMDEWQCKQFDQKADEILEKEGCTSLRRLRSAPTARVSTKSNPSLDPVCPVEPVPVQTLNVSFRVTFRDLEIVAPTEADAVKILVNRLMACGMMAEVDVEPIDEEQIDEKEPSETVFSEMSQEKKEGKKEERKEEKEVTQEKEEKKEEKKQEKREEYFLGGEVEILQDSTTQTATSQRKKTTKTNTELPEEEKTEFVFPLIGEEEFTLSKTDLARFEKYYLGINVQEQLRACIAWNFANPKNRKTRAGILRHINTWLGTEQNRARRPNNNSNNFQQPRIKSPYAEAGFSFENVQY